MATDTFVNEVDGAWPEVLADSWEVLEHARKVWRDEDREVELDNDGYERGEL